MKNVLIIGAGGIGRRHIKGYLSTNRASLSIVEPDDEKNNSIQKEFSIDKTYTSIEQANLDQFDLAVICSPANMHVDAMKICAQNNLSFMVEKPLSTSMEGIDEIIQLVEKNNLFARVGYTRRNSHVSRALKNQLDNNKVGDVKLVYINSSQEFPKYRPDYQTIYYASPRDGRRSNT